MKRWIWTFFVLNLICIILLFLLIDPFTFFPKTYEDSPPFITLDLNNLKTINIEEREDGRSSQITFSKENSTWYISLGQNSKKYLASIEKVSEILGGLEKIHRFEKDRKIVNDNDFIDKRVLSLSLTDDRGVDFHIDFGKCFQPSSECFIREKNSRVTYPIPLSILEKIPDVRIESYLLLKPFSSFNTSEIQSITYQSNGLQKYSIFKLNGRWKTNPEISGELDEQNVNNLLLRLVSWSGESAFLMDHQESALSERSTMQSLRVEYKQQSGEILTLEVRETLDRREGGSVNKIYPFDQAISMSSFGWEYWKYYDIRQLSSKVD